MSILTVLAALALLPAAPASADKIDVSNKTATTACVLADRDLQFRRTPGCSGEISRAGRRVLMSYNALGLRDKDYPRASPPKTERVLVMGGSLMAAPGLAEKDTPPRAFERELRRRGIAAEVIDGSGEGYTGWQNAARLKELVDAYAPKYVVYHLASHYIFTDRALWYDLRVERGEVRGRKSLLTRLPKRSRAFFSKRRAFLFMLRTYLEQWGRIQASRRIAALRPEAGLDDLLAPTLSGLAQMSAACRPSGARLLVVYDGGAATADQFLLIAGPSWPGRLAQWLWIKSLRFEGDAVEKRLREDGAKTGYRLLSIASARPALADPANRLDGDYHWNESGAGLFAATAAEAFVKARP